MIYFVSPLHDYSTLVNSIGIFLEIGGFVLTIKAVKDIQRERNSNFYRGLPNKDELPNIMSLTNSKYFRCSDMLIV